MAASLAKCYKEECESAAQASRSYWSPVAREQFASVCEDTGRPGNPGASCWVEPMPKAYSWRAPGCVCVYTSASHHCSRAAGLEDLCVLVPATEESSSGSRAWTQLQNGCSQALEGSFVCMAVFPPNRFVLISQSREED